MQSREDIIVFVRECTDFSIPGGVIHVKIKPKENQFQLVVAPFQERSDLFSHYGICTFVQLLAWTVLVSIRNFSNFQNSSGLLKFQNQNVFQDTLNNFEFLTPLRLFPHLHLFYHFHQFSSSSTNLQQSFFFYKFFEDIIPFCGTTDIPVLDFWWCLPWVSKPGWIPCMHSYLCDPQVHLWCDTYWLYRSQHGSWAFLIYVLADVSTSIGGGLGINRVATAQGKQGI